MSKFSRFTGYEMVESKSEEASLFEDTEEVDIKSNLCCFRKQGRYSVQSGDIRRTTPEEETDNEQDPTTLSLKERLLQQLHLIIYKVVGIFFCNLIPPVITLFFILVLIPVGLTCLAYFVYPPQLDLSLRSFQIPNHKSSLDYDAFQMALHPYVTAKDDTSPRRRRYSSCTEPQSLLKSWMLDIFYVSKDGTNILTEKRIKQIHHVEKSIVQHRFENLGYEDFCHKSSPFQKCDPLNSLLTYFYPSYDGNSWVYDGNGDQMQPINATLAAAFQSDASYWYVGSNFKADKMESKLLRSQLRVGVPITGHCHYYDSKSAIHEKVTNYFISFVPYLDSASTGDIEVLYGGTEIFDYEVEQAIAHDKLLALVSLGLVAPLVFVLSGFSFFSTITALWTLASSFPLAFFFYRVVFGIKVVGLLNVVSVFVIIGIGVDDVFVFLNTFKQAGDLEGVKTLQDRLAYTIIHACKATFLTSSTTAVAFLANALSAIPAVHQFGLFMGLVVMFCYVQVSLVMPSFLYLWQKYLSRFEYLYFICCLRCKSQPGDSDSVDSGEHDSTDSGIALMSYGHLIDQERSFDEEESGSNVTSEDETDMLALLTQSPISQDTETGTKSENVTALSRIENGMKKMTAGIQWFVLKYVSWPLVFVRVPLLCVFALFLVASIITASFLRPSEKAPQFLDSDSNIQKLLDLQSEVSQQNDYDCWNCSAFFVQKEVVFPSSLAPWLTSSTSMSPQPTTSHHNDRTTTSARINPTSTTHTSSSLHASPTSTPVVRPTSSKGHTTSTRPHAHSSTTSARHHATSATPTYTPPAPPTQICSGDNYDKCVNNQATKPAFGGGVVYVVFGISGIKRTYSPSHVIVEDGNLGVTQYDKDFQKGVPICHNGHIELPSIGVRRALCRICKSFSNSSLVQPNGAYCFPSNFTTLSCIGQTEEPFKGIEECNGLSTFDSKVTAKPVAQTTAYVFGDQSMLFMAMAFKSTTDTNKSPFNGYNDYLRWNDFLDAELAAIADQQKYDDAYKTLKSAFQTSDYWVVVNTEVIAVYGAIYGIVLSFLLCMILITFLSRNWRILVSMFATIVGILFLLMACFKAFGWSLGIVEAVTLSIIVGNSLDYCIHLTQAYQDVDHRHLALLNKLGVTNLSIRSQKVMAGMAYIGVSIISSAITTFLATLPLLATEIQLFRKFGEILVLDTAIAILYTVLFCSSMLTFIGPKTGNSPFKFQILTMATPLVATGVLFLCLFIAAKCGVDIPSPLGGYLFQ